MGFATSVTPKFRDAYGHAGSIYRVKFYRHQYSADSIDVVQTPTRPWYSMMATKAKVNARLISDTILQKTNLITAIHLQILGYIPLIRLVDVEGWLQPRIGANL